MSNYSKPNDAEEYEKNFSQIKPLMNETMAYYESSRCLFCYDAPCITACPTEIDIPLFIRQINTGNLKGAARTIYSSNYFGHICGKVCPTEVLCEGACVYNLQDVNPIEIGRLQSFATTQAIQMGSNLFKKKKANHLKVAIIGAGPAGIAGACELALLGYDVDIFEARNLPSGLALHGTAPYKITNEEVLNEVSYLQKQFGFTISYNHGISSPEQISEIETNYDAILLAIGLGTTKPSGIRNEKLKNRLGATEFIEQLKLTPLDTHVGTNVVVIGGGNTAMDAASESARFGSNVTLVYRRSRGEMKAYDFEYDLVMASGVDSLFNTTIVEVVGREKVEKVICRHTSNVAGRIEINKESSFEIECDMLIMATGQIKQTDFLDKLGIPYDEKGKIQVNSETCQCQRPKYFAAGDAVNGGAEVVNACAEGKKAALGIHAFLNPSS